MITTIYLKLVVTLWAQKNPYLAAEGSDIVRHLDWIGEVLRVPDKVLVVWSVLNVKPKDVEWDLRLIEVGLYFANVVRAEIVPTTLVVAK
jgi:hypothetical protein